MMETSCLLAVTVMSCESAYQKLNSINALKKINFGQSVPKHTLLLLHWFANTVEINNNIVCLTFDPNTDFGSHYYGNHERILDPLPLGQRYYTVGNLNQVTSNALPVYVRNPPVEEYKGTNIDRIIFQVWKQHSGLHRIDRVYITQHVRQSNRYDPEYTYQISTNLLRQIRQFSVGNQRLWSVLRDQIHSSADVDQLRDIIITWGKQACVGLMLFIVIKDSNNKCDRPQQDERPEPQQDEGPEPQQDEGPEPQQDERPEPQQDERPEPQQDERPEPQQEVGPEPQQEVGPEPQQDERPEPQQDERPEPQQDERPEPQQDERPEPQQDERPEPQQDERPEPQQDEGPEMQQEGQDENLKPQNCSLQKWCLILVVVFISFVKIPDHHNIVQTPGGVTITDYDANLELFVKQDKTCARLHVNDYFTDWRSKFSWSWVGFYKSSEKDTNQYEWGQWQWAVQFKPCHDSVHINEYKCFEYCSEMVAAPGVQIRFILRQSQEIAHTQKPEGVELTGHNAQLQLFVREGKACARLYVKKSFTEWKSEFYNSWVGFYESANKGTYDYEWRQWQWAIEFKQYPDSDQYREYDIFEYCSKMTYAQGMHVRFMHRDTIEIARHPSW